MPTKYYSEITMTLKERQQWIDDNRHQIVPRRLLLLTTRLNRDRAAQAMIKKITWHPAPN